MSEEVMLKLEELLDLLRHSSLFEEYALLRKRLEKEEGLLKEIQELKEKEYPYSEYVEKKKRIMEHPLFCAYQEKDREVSSLVGQINQRLSLLTKE